MLKRSVVTLAVPERQARTFLSQFPRNSLEHYSSQIQGSCKKARFVEVSCFSGTLEDSKNINFILSSFTSLLASFDSSLFLVLFINLTLTVLSLLSFARFFSYTLFSFRAYFVFVSSLYFCLILFITVVLLSFLFPYFVHTRWFKYDRDKLWLVYTQIVPVIFEPPCISLPYFHRICFPVFLYFLFFFISLPLLPCHLFLPLFFFFFSSDLVLLRNTYIYTVINMKV